MILLLLLGAGAWFLLSRDTTHRTIAIYSSPSGARAIFNGTELGRTPLPQASIPGKGGTLRLEKQDYTPVEQEIGKDDDRVNLRLVLAPYKVKVVTDPGGAEVLLDGHSEGYAPTELTIPGEGRHTLEIRSDGYDSWETTLARHQPLPNPIRLNKDDHAKANKVKQFLKGLLDQ